MSIDYSIFQLIHGLANRWWLFDWLGIFLAQYLPYLIVLFAFFLLAKEKNWRQRIYFFALAGLSIILSRGIITEIIRFFYYRPRPFLALQFQSLLGDSDIAGSFPSGHAAAYFALALAIFYFLKQKKNNYLEQPATNLSLGWLCLGAVILIGVARIFVGVHWPSDVLVGALIGLGSAFLVKKILPAPQSKLQK